MIVSDFIFNVGDTAYDLRKVLSYSVDESNAQLVKVRFVSIPDSMVTFPKTAFETAYAAALAAEGG